MTITKFPMMNWRRGIAEVALIFIGITLALLFDNWNEARKDRILEEQLFAALRADLLETRTDLVKDLEEAEELEANTSELIQVITSEEPPKNAGTQIFWRMVGTSRLYKKDFAYRALIAQGLGSITNWQILEATTDLYELHFSRAAAAEASATSLERRYLEQLFPHMLVPAETLEKFSPGQSTRPFLRSTSIEIIDWEAMRTDRELVHWLMELLERSYAASVFYSRALSQLDGIVDMIDKEIGSSEQNTKSQ